MISLLKAEYLKVSRHVFWIAIPIGMVAFVALYLMGCSAMILMDGSAGMCGDTLAFPDSYRSSLRVARSTSVPLALILAALSIGGEYTQDTWKAILPRRGSRWPFIVSKFLMSYLWLVLSTIAMIITFCVVGAASASVVQLDPVTSSSFSSADLLELGEIFVEMAYYCSLSTLASVALQSATRSIILALVLPIMMFALSAQVQFLAWLLPIPHFRTLIAQATQSPAHIKSATELFGSLPSWSFSLIVLVAYIVAQVALALLIFEKRDVSANGGD